MTIADVARAAGVVLSNQASRILRAVAGPQWAIDALNSSRADAARRARLAVAVRHSLAADALNGHGGEIEDRDELQAAVGRVLAGGATPDSRRVA